MRSPCVPVVVVLCLVPAWAQTIDVGTSAPSEAIRQRFVQAYFRNNFSSLVSLPPLGEVKRLGTTGLVQEFPDAAKTQNVKLALVKADTSTGVVEGVIDVWQMQASMYAYYLSLGAATVGYPTNDTTSCPPLAANSCQFQLFDRSYALFTYAQPTINGQTFAVKDTLYVKWVSLGGAGGLGPPETAEQTVTSKDGTTAAYQGFTQGALFSITSGVLNGRLVTVRQPIFDVYVSNGGHTAFLGFPVSEEVTLANGRQRQTFQGGSIEYEPGSTPVLRLPVNTVVLSTSAASVRMALGETLAVQATAFSADGRALEGRDIVWTTSNSRVVSLEPSGPAVVLRAVGGGSAVITAVSEGRSSERLSVFVTAPCCQIGEGAPTAAIQQAFQDAVMRNNLSLRLPAPSPVRRLGAGYVQEFSGAGPNSSVRYLLAKPDQLAAAFVVTELILARYQEIGGPGGLLGYPLSDATTGGRQLFENGALAGSPVRRISGPILSKWATSGYESGPAGLPVDEASTVLTFAATDGVFQSFAQGAIFAALSGPQAGRAFFAGGLILARYNAEGGPAGRLGLPMSDEVSSGGLRRQVFEGGFIEYVSGGTEARVVESERQPQVRATPSSVLAGGRLRLSVSGFAPAAGLRVSVTGQPDFIVTTATGAHSWEVAVPAAAPSATVSVRAADMNSTESAQGSYVVRSIAETPLRLTKVRGDGQKGLPGGLLPLPLRVAVRDETGAAVSGVAVRFSASPGAAIEAASVVTDSFGEAQAMLRLPLAEGLALATAEAGRQVATFEARVVASSLTNFPRQTQAVDRPLGKGSATIAKNGALLTAAASILRYYQQQGSLVTANGFADPAVLNDFLTSFCAFDAQGAQICDGFIPAPESGEQIVNLWRLGAFVAGNLDVAVEEPSAGAVRDQLAQGAPVLLVLSMTSSGAPAGSHFVVATGVDANGGILIHDPNPVFGRSRLNEYVSGFASGSRDWKAAWAGTVLLVPGSPAPSAFLVATGEASAEVISPAGACGRTLSWPDVAATDGAPPARPPSSVRFRYCDGARILYELDVTGHGDRKTVFTDLGNPGGRVEISAPAAASFKLARPVAQWTVTPQDVDFAASSVVSAASFLPDLAPGALAAIFGSGLAGPGGTTTVEIGGLPAVVVSASPFQVNAQVPFALAPGTHPVRVNSPHGSAEQPADFREVAPAIFVAAGEQGAVLNQDGGINGPSNPARRGQAMVIFATGFGAVLPRGSLQAAQTPVSALLEDRELPAGFAGLAPGFVGLYQANVPIPIATPPGLNLRLRLRQGGALSNRVRVSIQ